MLWFLTPQNPDTGPQIMLRSAPDCGCSCDNPDLYSQAILHARSALAIISASRSFCVTATLHGEHALIEGCVPCLPLIRFHHQEHAMVMPV